MKKRIILLVLPMLLASCSSSKKIETNKEIKEISTQIATSIKGVDQCKAYQYEESSSLIDKYGRLTSSHLIEAADYVNKKAYFMYEDSLNNEVIDNMSMYYFMEGSILYGINTTNKNYYSVDIDKYTTFLLHNPVFKYLIEGDFQQDRHDEMFNFVKIINTYLPDDDNAPLVNNKKYFASLSTFSEGSIALDFHDQTLVPEEEKEIYEASVKNETYFSLSISSYRYDRLFYQYSRLDGSLIVSQREGKFSYDKKVKINIPSYEGYENITEKLLKGYGIAV